MTDKKCKTCGEEINEELCKVFNDKNYCATCENDSVMGWNETMAKEV